MNSDQIKFISIVEFMMLPITYWSINTPFSEVFTPLLCMINIIFILGAFGGTQHPMYDFGNPENNPYLKER